MQSMWLGTSLAGLQIISNLCINLTLGTVPGSLTILREQFLWRSWWGGGGGKGGSMINMERIDSEPANPLTDNSWLPPQPCERFTVDPLQVDCRSPRRTMLPHYLRAKHGVAARTFINNEFMANEIFVMSL